MTDLTAATIPAAAAAVNMSWPPVTAVVDARGVMLTGERAGVTEAAVADGCTTATFLCAFAAAEGGEASSAVPAAGDRPATLTAVASASGAHAAASAWVRVDMVARAGLPALTERSSSCPRS